MLMSILFLIIFQVLHSITALQSTHVAKEQQSRNLENTMARIQSPLNETSYELVDTQMRWRDHGDYQVSDKFYAKYKDMMQCTSKECTWLTSGGSYQEDLLPFGSNYNYFNGSVNHASGHLSDHASGRDAGYSGRVYSDLHLFADQQQTQCRFDGSPLSPWIKLDVLQFPTPRTVTDRLVMDRGNAGSPDWQGLHIFAPFYNSKTRKLELRRYSIYVSDFFEEFPWKSASWVGAPVNPLYQKSATSSVDLGNIETDVANATSSHAYAPPNPNNTNTNSNPTVLTNYNDISISGSKTPPRPPKDWGMFDKRNEDKPNLHDLLDFDGDGLIETKGDLDGDGNFQVGMVNGDPTPDSDATFEQFRLYPSKDIYYFDGTGSWNDSNKDDNDTQALIFHKHEDDASRLKGSFEEMAVYYFIDLETGWTRLYFFCQWNDGVTTQWYEVNASFVREPYPGLDQNYKTNFFTPYETIAQGVHALDFSTSESYPVGVDVGGIGSQDTVRVGISVEDVELERGTVQLRTSQMSKSIHPRHPNGMDPDQQNAVK